MIYRADSEFIEKCLDDFAGKTPLFDFAKKFPFNPENAGVPPEMFDGEPDADGWVRWKMLASTVTEKDLAAIEQRLPGRFPPLFRAFLTARFTMSIENAEVRLPALPSDNPLGELLSTLDACSVLLPAGLVALAADGNDARYLCFDFGNRLPDGDCPIVLFDHEHLINFAEKSGGERRRQMIEYAVPAYASFRELLEKNFL